MPRLPKDHEVVVDGPAGWDAGAGAASRVSLGTAVFGGMLIGVSGMVLLTPVFYLVIQRMAEGPEKPRPLEQAKGEQTS